jgi:Spy/CpxP family protein refolding chaperone
MKTTKYLLLAACVLGGLLLSGSPGQAAEKSGKGDRHARAAAAKDRLQQMAEELNLTPEQKEKVKPILQEEAQKLRALRQDASLSPEQKREKARELRQELVNKLKPILTPEQLEKWQRLHAQRPGKRGEKKAETK